MRGYVQYIKGARDATPLLRRTPRQQDRARPSTPPKTAAFSLWRRCGALSNDRGHNTGGRCRAQLAVAAHANTTHAPTHGTKAAPCGCEKNGVMFCNFDSGTFGTCVADYWY